MKRWIAAFSASVVLAFPLSSCDLGGDDGDTIALAEVRTWACNLTDIETARQREQLVGSACDMYVLEPVVTVSGMGDFDIAGLVRDIRQHNMETRGRNPIILAYVDIGQAEEWRWYWQEGWEIGDPDWILSADPDGWEGNYPVAYWREEWRSIVLGGQVEATLRAGFDGIYMDWVGGFSEPAVVAAATAAGVDPAAAMIDLIEAIRVYARSGSPNANPAYLVVAQNAAELYHTNPSRYLELVDAIALEGIWYDGDGGFDDWNDPDGYNVPTDEIYPGLTEEVLSLLDPMEGRLPIFCLEYAQDVGGAACATEVYTELAPAHGFVPYCSRRSLSMLSSTPPPGGDAGQGN